MSNKFQDIIPCEKIDKTKKNLIIFDDCVNDKNQEIME